MRRAAKPIAFACCAVILTSAIPGQSFTSAPSFLLQQQQQQQLSRFSSSASSSPSSTAASLPLKSSAAATMNFATEGGKVNSWSDIKEKLVSVSTDEENSFRSNVKGMYVSRPPP
jgi:hypothetical protein